MVNDEKKKKKKKTNYTIVTTSIEKEMYAAIKAEGIPLNHIVSLGWLAFKDNPQLIKRIAILEDKVARMERTDAKLYGRIDQITGELVKEK